MCIGKMTYFFEAICFSNWFNPLLTLYLNFRSFPINQARRLPVFVYGWPKLFSLHGSMECRGMCERGMITLNKTNINMPNNPGPNTAIYNVGKIIFYGKCCIYTANKINVMGTLELGDETFIMCMCNITAERHVKIGSHVLIAHRSQVFDTNFHYVADFNEHQVRRITRPVEIGSYCWICNSATIAPGAQLPDRTIVASNSLVNKDMRNLPEESIIGGIPAKFISKGFECVWSKKRLAEIETFFSENPSKDVFLFSGDTSHSSFEKDE